MVNQYLVMNLNLKKKCFWSRSNKWLCGGGLSGISLKGTLQVPNSFWLLMWHQCTGKNGLIALITQCQNLWKKFCPTILKYINKAANYFFFIYSEFLYFASYFNLGGWMVGGGVRCGVSLWSNVYNCPSLIKLVHYILRYY